MKKEIKSDVESKKKNNKKENIKEEKIIENHLIENKSKIIIITVIILGIIFLITLLLQLNIISIPFINKKVELQTTKVNTKIKEGIYITDVSEVVEETMPAIVSITSKSLVQTGFNPFYFGNQQQYVEGAGSGIIIAKNNDEILILTNNHVVADSEELTVKFIDEKEVDATIKGESSRKDVAVISVKIKDLEKETLEKIKIATVGDSNALKVGNGIIAIGNALGYGQSVTTGVVSALNREISNEEGNKYIQIDAAINGGNSGGALLNSKGEVVGINSAKYSSSGSSQEASIEGMGFAIPISDVKDLIEDLASGKEENENSGIKLGIEGYMTNSENFEGYNLPVGFYISSIEKNSYADKNKLEIGNIITKVEGKDVTSINDLKDALYGKKKGDSLKITIKYASSRTYKEKEIVIKF